MQLLWETRGHFPLMNTLCSPWLIFRVFFIPSRFILAAGSRVGNSLFRSSLFRAKSLILKRESLSLFFKKSDCEQIAPIALYKKKLWAMGAIRSFSWANCSFAHKKRANRSKNRWANSQPWWYVDTMKRRHHEMSTIWNCRQYETVDYMKLSALWNCRHYETVDYMKLSAVWYVLSLCKCWQCETSWHSKGVHRCSCMLRLYRNFPSVDAFCAGFCVSIFEHFKH